jgi:hypothetical protein
MVVLAVFGLIGLLASVFLPRTVTPAPPAESFTEQPPEALRTT